MDILTLLQPGTMLVANPHRYDYLHDIELVEDGTVRMVDGGCQAIRRRIIGRYEVTAIGPAEATVRFFDLRDVDPYARSEETRDIETFTARVVLEQGPFAYECEVVWNVKPNEEPYVLFQKRLAFDRDPLAAGTPPFPDFPPEALEVPEIRDLVESLKRSSDGARRYYVAEDRVEMPCCEIEKLNLPPESVHVLGVR
jgi:hypothetical protein